jgi:SepF-like predicted cell division protein (DUF552 family)
MGLAKLFGARRRDTNDYIDLGEYVQETTNHETAASMYVRVADLAKLEDVRGFIDYLYKGNMLILDFSGIAEDEVTLRRATNEFKSAVTDCGGDIAGFGKNLLLLTPTGVKIDRQKLRPTQ